MPPQYRIVDKNSFGFEELLMADHFMFDPESKLGRNLYEFYRKYFLEDYESFLKTYDLNYNNSLLNKLILNKRKNFPENSFDSSALDFLIKNTIPLLRHKGMSKESNYISNFIDYNNEYIIDNHIYDLIKLAFKDYENKILNFMKYNEKKVIRKKAENF